MVPGLEFELGLLTDFTQDDGVGIVLAIGGFCLGQVRQGRDQAVEFGFDRFELGLESLHLSLEEPNLFHFRLGFPAFPFGLADLLRGLLALAPGRLEFGEDLPPPGVEVDHPVEVPGRPAAFQPGSDRAWVGPD